MEERARVVTDNVSEGFKGRGLHFKSYSDLLGMHSSCVGRDICDITMLFRALSKSKHRRLHLSLANTLQNGTLHNGAFFVSGPAPQSTVSLTQKVED